MANITGFKRLNFFTGFFTTADDWNEGQDYHLEKRRLHNRGLHTPGVISGERDELQVEAAGGLNIRVMPGAALDGAGNEIYLGVPRTLTVKPGDYDLPRLVYVAMSYREEESGYVENVDTPEFSGNTRISEIPRLELTTEVPDNMVKIELARVDIQTGVTVISAPLDPQNPGGNEIDTRFVRKAGAVGVEEEMLSPPELQRLIHLMADGRRDFAALEGRFSVPSAADSRQGALTLEMLARLGAIRPGQLGDVFAALAAVEQDVTQELGATYPALVATPEFTAYRDTVSTLLEHIRNGAGTEALLTAQATVSEAARELSEIALRVPEADAGGDVTVTAREGEATVTLDASSSRPFEGRRIVRYYWNEKKD